MQIHVRNAVSNYMHVYVIIETCTEIRLYVESNFVQNETELIRNSVLCTRQR
jgi:hypothetical protein